jgi:hypothetical protein
MPGKKVTRKTPEKGGKKQKGPKESGEGEEAARRGPEVGADVCLCRPMACRSAFARPGL